MVGDGELERAEDTLREFIDGLLHHIDIEERILFPLFEQRTGVDGPTRVMRAEHRRITLALTAMRAALEHQDAGAFAEAELHLDEVLKNHDIKEEHVIYPTVDRALADEERLALVNQLLRA
jgi:hemerythrin-like domain-containing protein